MRACGAPTGPASAATVARKLSALSGFYDYGLHDAGVLTHSPVASVRRPKVADESQAVGLTAEELKRLLAAAAAHSPRSAALVSVLIFCGLRISEALGADVRDYSHDQGHRVLKVTRKGGKAGRVALAPQSSEASTPTSRSAPADRCSSHGTAPPATRIAARTSSWPVSAAPLASRPASRPTACATPTPPSPCTWALHCRTSRTRSVTLTRAPPGDTTATATDSTGPPTTCWPGL